MILTWIINSTPSDLLTSRKTVCLPSLRINRTFRWKRLLTVWKSIFLPHFTIWRELGLFLNSTRLCHIPLESSIQLFHFLLDRIVSGNEKWFVYDNVLRERSWKQTCKQAKTAAKTVLHSMKLLLSVCLDCREVIHFLQPAQLQTGIVN